jgi:glycogen operon protein
MAGSAMTYAASPRVIMERSARSRRVFSAAPDIYGAQEREPEQSINFVTCHDGFTLNDLVSYDRKHNEANRESNRDGSDVNHSWNCGVEGPTQNWDVEQLRNRQIKNFLALTLFATGTPMLLMGDEIRRTQGGNNNGYCIDDETAWFDWSAVTRHAEIHRFVRQLIAFRKARMLPLERAAMTLNELIAQHRIEWHGVALGEPDWSDASHSLAATFRFDDDGLALHLMINAYWEPLAFAIPPLDEKYLPWRRCMDTYRTAPEDIRGWLDAEAVHEATFIVQPRSIVVLVSKSTDSGMQS